MRARGFTLVEVMVALAIVAIALPAVLISLYRQVDDTAYLRDKTMAQMVAANKLAEIRLVVAATRILTAGKDSGVTPMADRDWHWWVETKLNDKETPNFFRIEIRVALAEERREQPLYTLTAFMSGDLAVDKAAPGGQGSGEGDGTDGGAGGGAGSGTDGGVGGGAGSGGATPPGQNTIPGLDPNNLPPGVMPDGT